MAADWPGYFPAGPATVRLLIEAGADPNADTGGDSPETPLHWAASSDDADVADALISGGANIETPGGSIGTPLDNAVGYGCWNVARHLKMLTAPRSQTNAFDEHSGIRTAMKNLGPPTYQRRVCFRDGIYKSECHLACGQCGKRRHRRCCLRGAVATERAGKPHQALGVEFLGLAGGID